MTPIVSGLPFFYVRGAPPGNVGYFLDGIRVRYLNPGGYPARFGRYAGGIVSAETTAPRTDTHGEGNIRLFDVGALVETGFADGKGVAIDMAGTAVRGAVTKHFRLMFRLRVRYGNCRLEPDAGPGINLASSAVEVYDIRIEAEPVLRDDVDAAVASLRFEPFANADKDGDGNVTLDELRNVPIAAVRDGGAFEAGTYDFDDGAGIFRNAGAIPITTFGDYVYELLLPSLPRFRDTGNCTVGLGRNRGGFG